MMGKNETGVLSMPQKIYLADDEKNIRDLIAAFLSQEGSEVKTFENGDALLFACDTALPDLVILDIMMPGTDGLSVCSALRKASADLPIIIVSAAMITWLSPFCRWSWLPGSAPCCGGRKKRPHQVRPPRS